MRVLTLDELPRRFEPQRIALTQAAFGGFLAGGTLREFRRRSRDPAPYFGLYAVEGGELVGEATVRRFRFRLPGREVAVSGIASVTTREDRQRRGIAATLLAEAHRREAAAGLRYALLWTSPGWFAHPLYEKLGYRDVYVPSFAVRELRRGTAGPASVLRAASREDLPKLEALRRRLARDRLGFVRREPGALSLGAELGLLEPSNLRVLEVEGTPVAYALVSRGAQQLRCGEFVAPTEHRTALIGGLERETAPGAIVFANTPVVDLRRELRARGYQVGRIREWRSLMAARLGRRSATVPTPHELGTDRREFLCMSLDRF